MKADLVTGSAAALSAAAKPWLHGNIDGFVCSHAVQARLAMAPDRNPNTFGGRLREARERRGISLRQIANATKIAVAVLEALERNDISRLPGGIFGRAFVRSYAVEVGLDPERTIQEFITQFPHDSVVAGHPTRAQVDVHYAVQNKDRRASAVFLVLLVGIMVAGWAVYFGVWRTLASYAAPFVTVQWTPASTPPQPPPIVPAAAAAADRSTAERRAPIGDRAAHPTPLPVAPQLSTGGVEDRLTVRLSVSRPCWVSAMVDGRKAIERLLQTGEDQTINVRREIVLTAADAGAVALTLNGESAKPLGQAGEVVTARLSLANFRDFLTTR